MNLAKTHSWQQIHEELMRRINDRTWPPGELIPREIELAEAFGCARATINRAMRELANAGLIDRRKKAGTRVAVHPTRKATLDIPITRMEIEKRGFAYRHALIFREIVEPPRLVSSQLKLSGKHPILHLQELHLANNRPFLYEDRWVNTAAVPDIVEVDFETSNCNEWLVHNAPFSNGDITFYAAKATQDEAEYLATQVDEALFIIERTTWHGQQAITSVRLSYAPEFRMHTTL